MHNGTKDYPQTLGLGYQRNQRYSIIALIDISENYKIFYNNYNKNRIYKDTYLLYI
jgi:hypothetical protein